MINFSNWTIYDGASEGSGRSEKIWLKNPETNQTGLFKFKKDIETTDHISEHMAYCIATILDIPCAKFDIGIYNGKEGSMSYNIVNPETMIFAEGISFINLTYPAYNPEQFIDLTTKRRYSIEMLTPILKKYQVFNEFIQMLIFDFLIGNTDRHHSNWALISEDKKWYFSPLYDNSSSLCAYISGEQLKKYLGKDKLAWNSLIDSKSKSRIRINFFDTKEPTHKMVMQYLAQNYYEQAYPCIKNIQLKMTDKEIYSILQQYNKYLLSPEKKSIIHRFLHDKIKMLEEIFKKEN